MLIIIFCILVSQGEILLTFIFLSSGFVSSCVSDLGLFELEILLSGILFALLADFDGLCLFELITKVLACSITLTPQKMIL